MGWSRPPPSRWLMPWMLVFASSSTCWPKSTERVYQLTCNSPRDRCCQEKRVSSVVKSCGASVYSLLELSWSSQEYSTGVPGEWKLLLSVSSRQRKVTDLPGVTGTLCCSAKASGVSLNVIKKVAWLIGAFLSLAVRVKSI